MSASVAELRRRRRQWCATLRTELVELAASLSAPILAASIVRDRNPDGVLDVGCRTGGVLMELRFRGAQGVGECRSARPTRSWICSALTPTP